MPELEVTIDPAAIGFDPDRLRRIDRHFARLVDEAKLPGWHIIVTRNGSISHSSTYGLRDREGELPVEEDTQWRIFSMTKPITAVAALMLYELGALELTEPIGRHLPEFADMRVYAGGSSLRPLTVPATEPIRVWHLLTHTSGLTYGFHNVHPVDALYRATGFDFQTPPGMNLAECCEALSDLPLVFEPGTGWSYSMSTDVLGRLVEVVSGQPLDEFLTERVLKPLGMDDTAFHTSNPDRLAAMYVPGPVTGEVLRDDRLGAVGTSKPAVLSGGGGLVSTAADYHRFTQMLLRGGELDGVRLLGSRTVDLMTRNHLPDGADLVQLERGGFAETFGPGVGHGLGVSVLVDAVAAKSPAAQGEYAWGGAASTAFWVDPVEGITALFFTQLFPSTSYPIRSQLRQLVYQALVDQPPFGR